MEALITYIQSNPRLPAYIGLGAVLVLAAVIGWRLVRRSGFKAMIMKAAQDPELLKTDRTYQNLLRDKYDNSALLKHSDIVERAAEKNGREIISLLKFDDLWTENLLKEKRRTDLRRVLKYAAPKGLFNCFLVCLEKPELAGELTRWIDANGGFLALRKLALSGKGESFDGAVAMNMFREKLDEIREMAGDPEWASRYFAVKILLNDPGGRSERALWESFNDPHPLIRKTVALEFRSEDKTGVYDNLFNLVIKDPVGEVREASWKRIHQDFSGMFAIDPAALDPEETIHIIGLLRPGSKTDEHYALGFLEHENLEIRLAAARHLMRCGALERFCAAADLGDRDGFERSCRLLKAAAQVNETGFLKCIETADNPATLLICARILRGVGDRKYITALARKVLPAYQYRNEEETEVFLAALDCISERGNDEALAVLNDELIRRKYDAQAAMHMLGAAPERGDFIFCKTLISLLKDPEFKLNNTLRTALLRMPADLALHELIDIIAAGRAVHPHGVRMEALKTLGQMEMHYCLQTLMENLPILPIEEAKDFAQVLARYPRDVFVHKIEKLLSANDGKVRAAIMSVLPVTGENKFLPLIQAALKDADAEVRIASLWALIGYGDMDSVNKAFSMLRDPIETVRIEAARVLGSAGARQVLENLKAVLYDNNEVVSVKRAAIQGLGISKTQRSIEILVEFLEDFEEFSPDVVHVLSWKTGRDEVLGLIENFKDATPRVRDRITEAFRLIGRQAETMMADLLKEDIASLRPYLIQILENTGFVESKIRQLSHRDPNVRRKAAQFLSLVGTTSAFRGIVLAARDPDEDVRVQVARALEALEKDAGKEILKALEQDPDKKVRKYTHWALERLRTKSL